MNPLNKIPRAATVQDPDFPLLLGNLVFFACCASFFCNFPLLHQTWQLIFGVKIANPLFTFPIILISNGHLLPKKLNFGNWRAFPYIVFSNCSLLHYCSQFIFSFTSLSLVRVPFSGYLGPRISDLNEKEGFGGLGLDSPQLTSCLRIK